MITLDPNEIKILREGGKILGNVLKVVASKIRPGISSHELDVIAEDEILKHNAKPSFKHYRSIPGGPPFPASLCVSIDSEVVHGIPKKNKYLPEGTIVGLDLGIWYKGLCTDAAITVPVGKVSEDKMRLLIATKECLDKALEAVRLGNYTGDIGHAIESRAKQDGFSVVRQLVGHGVGKAVHEDPEIPCFGKPKTGTKLQEGMVLAIEPMINMGKSQVKFKSDGWTIVTEDGESSAHIEHSVIVTKIGCEILTLAD